MRLKIEKIKVKAMMDDSPDISFLGEYTDEIEPGIIVRETGEWIGTHLRFMGSENEQEIIPVPYKGREYRFFRPYAGGEKVGTRNYRKYGKQDYKRIRGLERGDWCFIGVQAETTVSYRINGEGSRRLEHLTSGGLWGIESDSEEYLKEIANEQLDDLKNHLEQFGVDLSDFDNLTKDIEIEYD